MTLKTVQFFLTAVLASAASPVIGTIVAKGPFRVDHSTATGNATLFEGASIETYVASSSMQLSGGARVLMWPESRARFFGDRMILEKGEGQLERAPGFHVEARGLRIQPETGDSSARVALAGDRQVRVESLLGSFRILNSRGLLVAKLPPGKALEFEPQTSDGPSRLLGCLHKIGAHFVLVDETTNVVVELAGPGLEKQAGNRVETTASTDATATPVFDASQFLRVISVKRVGKGCGSGNGTRIAAAAGAGGAGAGAAGVAGGGGGAVGGAAGAAAGAAVSIATPVAVVGGVAAAATVGGLAAAGKLPGQDSSPPSISR